MPAAATAAADRAAVSSAADGTGGPGARCLRMAGRMAADAVGSVVVAARSVILLITRSATARTTSATTTTNKIRSPSLTGPPGTRTSWAALVLWVTSQARAGDARVIAAASGQRR